MMVRESLRSAPVTVPPSCTLQEAARLMDKQGVGSLLVVSGGELLGIVTDRDIAIRGVGDGCSLTADVGAVMTEHPVTIQGSEDVLAAFTLLKEAGIRRIPVLEEGELAGIVTVDDLLVSLVLEFGAVVSPVAREILHREIPS
jgi:CBS domain-containing protein